jgi:hypothetical protein
MAARAADMAGLLRQVRARTQTRRQAGQRKLSLKTSTRTLTTLTTSAREEWRKTDSMPLVKQKPMGQIPLQ